MNPSRRCYWSEQRTAFRALSPTAGLPLAVPISAAPVRATTSVPAVQALALSLSVPPLALSASGRRGGG